MAALGRLPAYAAGKPASEVPGLVAYKLASNENPFGAVPAALGVTVRRCVLRPARELVMVVPVQPVMHHRDSGKARVVGAAHCFSAARMRMTDALLIPHSSAVWAML